MMLSRALAVLTLLQGLVCCAQSVASFEVASVKKSDPGSAMGLRRLAGGRLVTSNTSVQFLITWAYDVTDDRLLGAPGWLESEAYDVMAKTAVENPTSAQLQEMMRGLMAERFRLKVHRETRQLSLYALEVDGAAPKVHASGEGAAPGHDPFSMSGSGQLKGTAVTAAMLAKVLSGQSGRYVEDRTGFAQAFDFTLTWRPDGVADDSRPSVFTALREQLGLRLTAMKGPVEVIAIDQVERAPTDN